jgi:hypothetical protein
MRRIRLWAAAVLGLAAAVSPATAGVAHATDSVTRAPDSGHTVNMWSGHSINGRPVVRETCPDAGDLRSGAAEYKVKDNGISIRSAPDGPIQWSIIKGTPFVADWHINGSSKVYQCIAERGGKQWVVGIATGRDLHYGWVGMSYLTLVKPLHS